MANNDADQKALITLSTMMGQVSEGLRNVEEKVNKLSDNYDQGREKARDAHQQILDVLNDKLSKSEFETKYKAVGIIQWLYDHWHVVALIIGLAVTLGFLKYGDKFTEVKNAVETVKDGKKINK